MLKFNDDIIIPKNSKHTDWEVEIGFVIGKKCLYVTEEDALNYVLGFFLVTAVVFLTTGFLATVVLVPLLVFLTAIIIL